jgi:hypothetical protein
LRTADYATGMKSGDLEIYFRPLNYKNLNDNNQLQFEQQKLLQVTADDAVSESDKMTALTAAFKKLTDITVQSLALSISVIKTPQALVSEFEYINDFLKNCDRKLFEQVRDHVVSLREQSEMQPLNMSCEACKHNYKQVITLDMSSFFEPAS